MFPHPLSLSLSVSSCLSPLCRSPSRALLISGFTSKTTRGTRTTWAGSRSGSISSTAEPQGNTSRSWGRKSTPTEMMGASMVWENSCASHLTLELVSYKRMRNHHQLQARFWCFFGLFPASCLQVVFHALCLALTKSVASSESHQLLVGVAANNMK